MSKCLDKSTLPFYLPNCKYNLAASFRHGKGRLYSEEDGDRTLGEEQFGGDAANEMEKHRQRQLHHIDDDDYGQVGDIFSQGCCYFWMSCVMRSMMNSIEYIDQKCY